MENNKKQESFTCVLFLSYFCGKVCKVNYSKCDVSLLESCTIEVSVVYYLYYCTVTGMGARTHVD